MTYTGHLL